MEEVLKEIKDKIGNADIRLALDKLCSDLLRAEKMKIKAIESFRESLQNAQKIKGFVKLLDGNQANN